MTLDSFILIKAPCSRGGSGGVSLANQPHKNLITKNLLNIKSQTGIRQDSPLTGRNPAGTYYIGGGGGMEEWGGTNGNNDSKVN